MDDINIIKSVDTGILEEAIYTVKYMENTCDPNDMNKKNTLAMVYNFPQESYIPDRICKCHKKIGELLIKHGYDIENAVISVRATICLIQNKSTLSHYLTWHRDILTAKGKEVPTIVAILYTCIDSNIMGGGFEISNIPFNESSINDNYSNLEASLKIPVSTGTLIIMPCYYVHRPDTMTCKSISMCERRTVMFHFAFNGYNGYNGYNLS